MHKMRYLRVAVALGALAVIVACTQLNVASGTLCALCPVGFLEIGFASGSFPWKLLPGVIVVLAIVFALGRVFCSWVCPTSLVRTVFGGRTPRGLTGRVGSADAREKSTLLAQGAVLAALLVASFLVHFPVFCLFCPIGLTMGTLFAVGRTFLTWQPEWELVVFPVMLATEALLLRRWCAAICPLGFCFGLVSKARAKLGLSVLPRVDKSACRAHEGCRACQMACGENIHVPSASVHDDEDCTLCLDCTVACPTQALTPGAAHRTAHASCATSATSAASAAPAAPAAPTESAAPAAPAESATSAASAASAAPAESAEPAERDPA